MKYFLLIFLAVTSGCSGKTEQSTTRAILPSCIASAKDVMEKGKKLKTTKETFGEAITGSDRGGEYSTYSVSIEGKRVGQKIEVVYFGSRNFRAVSGYWILPEKLVALEVVEGNTIGETLAWDKKTLHISLVAIENDRAMGVVRDSKFSCPEKLDQDTATFLTRVKAALKRTKSKGQLDLIGL